MESTKKLPPSTFNEQSHNVITYLERHQKKRVPPTLYDHQVDAVLKLHQYFYGDDPNVNPASSNIALVVLPTGCGKTGVAVLASYALNAARVLVITPSMAISKQVYAAYEDFLVDRDIIKKKDKPYWIPTKQLITKSAQIKEAQSSSVMVTNAHKIGGKSSVAIMDINPNNYDLVIVDEAHHYPAPTWKLLVDHFSNSKQLFLTATPEHNGEPILDERMLCYRLDRTEAVDKKIIRAIDFTEVKPHYEKNEQAILKLIAKQMEHCLNEHDRENPTVKHQGMVLTQTKEMLNAANAFRDIYTANHGADKCEVYVSETHIDVLERFKRQEIRTLVIIGRLLEGFDHKFVSVLGIVRNVAPSSRVLFAQFVGRALRKSHEHDQVVAQLVTHKHFKQYDNYQKFETLAEEDPVDED